MIPLLTLPHFYSFYFYISSISHLIACMDLLNTPFCIDLSHNLFLSTLRAYRLSELKVANVMFILIAGEIVHIIRKQPRTKEIRRRFIFLNPVKNPMRTRAIFIRPDSELIRESVCACAKLFVDEESTWHKSNRGRTNILTDSIRKRHKKEDSASFV